MLSQTWSTYFYRAIIGPEEGSYSRVHRLCCEGEWYVYLEDLDKQVPTTNFV
jgi:hypothetical protein